MTEYIVLHCQADHGRTFVICDRHHPTQDTLLRTWSNTPDDRALADRVVALLNGTVAPTGPVIVALDGGLVQSVCSHDPALIGLPYVTVDYDTDSFDDDNPPVQVDQGDGTWSDAFISGDTIGKASIVLPVADSPFAPYPTATARIIAVKEYADDPEALVKEWANCREAEITAEGKVWIAGPQTGHWLDDDAKAEFAKWLDAE